MQATTNPIAAVPPRSIRAPLRPRGRRLDRSLQWIDESLDALFGADLRLILGMLTPMLLVIGLIVAFCQSPSYWLVGLTLVVEIGCLAMVVSKVLSMMQDPAETTGS